MIEEFLDAEEQKLTWKMIDFLAKEGNSTFDMKIPHISWKSLNVITFSIWSLQCQDYKLGETKKLSLF